VPGTLTKADIIAAIQTENGYTLKKPADIIETLLEIIKSSLASGGPVFLPVWFTTSPWWRSWCLESSRTLRKSSM